MIIIGASEASDGQAWAQPLGGAVALEDESTESLPLAATGLTL